MKAKSLILFIALLPIYISSWAQEYACTHLTEGPETITPPPSQLSLGVILIQFSDWQTNKDAEGSNGPAPFYEPGKYKFQHYYNMLFSAGTYIGYGKHPDDHIVYGSMRDYYQEVSLNQFDFSVDSDILNNIDGNSVPIWYTASHTKAYYDSLYLENESLANEAITLANANGFNTGAYDKLAIIYAGLANTGGSLHPQANDVGGEWYIMSEKVNNSFAHIGIHCHEFGHLLGLYDYYYEGQLLHNYSIGGWCLMGTGYKRGSNYGSCPVHLAGESKYKLGFITAETISENYIDTEINLSLYQNSNVLFRREVIWTEQKPPLPPIEEKEIFYIENRQPVPGTFEQYLPGEGLLIIGSKRGVIEADDNHSLYRSDIAEPGDVFPGSTGKTALTDFTTPNSMVDNGNRLSHFAVLNISENGNEITTDLIPNYWEGQITSSTTWAATTSNYYVGDDITIENSATLTIQSDATVDLCGNAIKVINGTLNRGDNVTFTPDIQLFRNSTTLTGQYSTIQQAIAYAATGDSVYINQDLTLESNVIIPDNVTLSFVPGSTIDLNGFNIETDGGTIDRDPSVIFAPDIQLFDNGTTLIGQYSDIWQTLEDVSSGDSIVVNSDISINSVANIPTGVTLTLKSGTTINLNGNYFRTDGGTIDREADVTLNPDIQLINDGTTLIGQYSHIQQAIDDASSGDNIYINQDLTVASNATIPTGITLSFKPGITIDLNGFNIETDGGTIDRDTSVTFIPDVRLLYVSYNEITGQYSDLQEALNDASSSEEVHVYSDVSIDDNVSVLSNRLLKIMPGNSLQFAYGKGLNVYGELYAYGQWNNRVVFTSIEPYTQWEGIKFYSNSSQYSWIYHCEIFNANYGIYLDHYEPMESYRYNYIHHCNYGIFSRYSAPEIKDSQIQDNYLLGVYVMYGNPAFPDWHIRISENDIRTTDEYDGIFLSESDAYIWSGNDIFDNQRYGVNAYTYSDVILVDASSGMNNVHYNHEGQLHFYDHCDGHVGHAGYYNDYGATNRILGNSYRVVAESSSDVYARRVWWGIHWWGLDPPEGLFYKSAGSTIDHNFPLEDDPTPSMLASPNPSDDTRLTLVKVASAASPSADSLRPIHRAIRYVFEAKYDSATTLCDSIIVADADHQDAIHAQSLLWRISRRTKSSDFVTTLSTNEQKYPDLEIGAAAQRIKGLILAGEKD